MMGLPLNLPEKDPFPVEVKVVFHSPDGDAILMLVSL